MSFSFSSLIRLLVFMAVGSTILAVGLSRLDPPRPSIRTLHAVKYSNVNEFFLTNVKGRTPIWLDHETGQMESYRVEDGDVLETASCSPWVDEKNQRQVAGRWYTRTNDGPMSISKDFGIARYAFPSGQMLDHVSTETVPVGPPCWYPGTQARIIFTAGDGMLYHYAFEPEPWVLASNPQAGRDLKPWPVVWQCPKPGMGKVYLSDLSWPDDPRMGGCLIVSLREQIDGNGGVGSYSRTSLWWLKLNFAGTEIVDLGKLIVDDESNETDVEYDHRTPTVGTLADGRLVLSYLQQKAGQVGWELRAVPIELDKDRQIPVALESQNVLLANRCQPAHPAFSSDGHWLNAITNRGPDGNPLLRLSLDDVFHNPK